MCSGSISKVQARELNYMPLIKDKRALGAPDCRLPLTGEITKTSLQGIAGINLKNIGQGNL
jgi:hypothetical protein